MISALNTTRFPLLNLIIRITLVFSFLTIFSPDALSQAEKTKPLTLDLAVETALLRNPTLVNDSLRKEAVTGIKKAWFNWLYSINCDLTMMELYTELSDLDRVTTLRYESGDISFMELVESRNILEELVTGMAVHQNQAVICQNLIRQWTFTDDFIQPVDSSLKLYEIDKSPLPYVSVSQSDTSPVYERFYRDLKIENLQLELDNLFIKYQYYRSFGLDYASGIIITAYQRLKSEDIEFLEYVNLLTKAFKIRIDYLEILNLYNQQAIQLEDYVN